MYVISRPVLRLLAVALVSLTPVLRSLAGSDFWLVQIRVSKMASAAEGRRAQCRLPLCKSPVLDPVRERNEVKPVPPSYIPEPPRRKLPSRLLICPRPCVCKYFSISKLNISLFNISIHYLSIYWLRGGVTRNFGCSSGNDYGTSSAVLQFCSSRTAVSQFYPG